MESKRSWFNRSALRLDLHNSWPIWAGYTLFWLVAANFMATSTYTLREPALEMARFWENCTGLSVFFVTPIYGCIVAAWLLRGLYHSRSALAIHALPVQRRQLFAAHLISGTVFLAIPTLVMAVYGLVRFLPGQSDLTQGLVAMGQSLGATWMMYLWCLGFALLCGMLTGQLWVAVGFFFTFNFLAVGLAVMVSDLCRKFLPGYASGGGLMEAAGWFSPWYNVGMTVSHYQGTLNGAGLLTGYALAGLVCMAAAYLLYRKRPLERAAELVIYRPLRVVLRWGVGLCSALFGSSFLQLLLGSTSSPVRLFALMTVCAWVGLLATRMLELKSFRVLNLRLTGEFGGMALVLALFMVALNTGGLGYVTRVPNPDKVDHIDLSLYNQAYYGPVAGSDLELTLTDRQQMEELIQWHREYSQLLLQNADYPDEKYNGVVQSTEAAAYGTRSGWAEEYHYNSMMIRYQYPNGGSMVRNYTVVTTRQGVGDPNDPDHQLAQVLSRVDIPAILESWAPYSQIYQMQEEVSYDAGSRNRAFMEALAQDLREGNWQYSFLEDPAFRDQEAQITLNIDYSLPETRGLVQGNGFDVILSEEYTPRAWELYTQYYQ